MASRKFRFVSPGVFLKEVDQSQLPAQARDVGPVLIGRTRKGPALKPYTVGSMEEFIRVFGEPLPGNEGEDPWREGTDLLAESYVPYAASSFLAADTDSPVTVVRLAGIMGEDAEDNLGTNASGIPGWVAEKAFGLFLVPSSSATGSHEMDLAAIFYTTDASASIKLKGKHISGSGSGSADGQPVKFLEGSNRLNIVISGSNSTREVKTLLSEIRKDFNTNPVATNDKIMEPLASTLASQYWLGETFEDAIDRFEARYDLESSGSRAAVVLELDPEFAHFKSTRHELKAARTGWFISNDTQMDNSTWEAEEQARLFRLVALQEGFHASKNLIVSIEDIKIPRDKSPNNYGSFSVVVKRIYSTKLEVVERFDNCNLNPNSDNFVSKKIGDQYLEWNNNEKRNKLYGTNPNMSEYIRVELHKSMPMAGPNNPGTVPFGFLGPIVPVKLSGSHDGDSGSLGHSNTSSIWISQSMTSSMSGTYTVSWPSLPVVHIADSEDSYMLGATPYRRRFNASGSAMGLTGDINPGYIEHVRRLSDFDGDALTKAQDSGEASGSAAHAFVFSMDEVVLTPIPSLGTGSAAQLKIETESQVLKVEYEPGSKKNSGSFSAQIAESSGSIEHLRTLTEVVKGFHAPLVGGFDGTDITEANPFNNRVLKDASTSKSYAFASVDRAIELVKDPEQIEHNLAAMPGITNATLTTKLVRICEDRADSLAIIDLPNVYVPPSEEKCDSFRDRIKASPSTSARELVNRQLNSSYGATYYPWVKIRDELSARDVWVPPSVVALGVMAYTEKQAAVWFAPAGFNRGGLDSGNAGIPVLQVSEHLLSRDRDTLYEANINPIASFVSEGLVIFGQKTLQSTQSALDRINVRRLLIYVKKFVSAVSSRLLFEQNVQATWNRFVSEVVPELNTIKSRFGLTDFKVKLDETTTTPDLVDRNILYAKIFLKPARAIEFIAVDFVITRTGAEFDD